MATSISQESGRLATVLYSGMPLLLEPLELSSQAVRQATAARAIADVHNSFFMVFSFFEECPLLSIWHEI